MGVERYRLIRLVATIAVILGSVLGTVGTSEASTSTVQVMIAGALTAPTGTTSDGEITLRLGVDLPVSLVSAGAVVPGPIGTATVAKWSDTRPSAGFGSPTDLMVLRFGGGFMVVAGGIATPSGFLKTFSATAPVERLSGTWTMTGGASAGVTGAGAGDAVVTFMFDLNAGVAIPGQVRLVLGGVQASELTKVVPGVAQVGVDRNIPVLGVANNAVGAGIGTLTSYSVFSVVGHGSEYARLAAIDFGGVFVLYGCAFPQLPGGIACLIGGADPLARLSGTAQETNAQFISDIAGLNNADVVLRAFFSLP